MQTVGRLVNDEGADGQDIQIDVPGLTPVDICVGPETISPPRIIRTVPGPTQLDFHLRVAGVDQPPLVTTNFSSKFVAFGFSGVGLKVPAGATFRVRATYSGPLRTVFVTVLMGD